MSRNCGSFLLYQGSVLLHRGSFLLHQGKTRLLDGLYSTTPIFRGSPFSPLHPEALPSLHFFIHRLSLLFTASLHPPSSISFPFHSHINHKKTPAPTHPSHLPLCHRCICPCAKPQRSRRSNQCCIPLVFIVPAPEATLLWKRRWKRIEGEEESCWCFLGDGK